MSGGTTTVPDAGSGFFPLDQQLHLIEKHRSEGVSKLTTWLCGQLSYEDAVEVLERVGGIHLSDTTAWRTTQQWGEQRKITEARQAEEAQQKPVESAMAVNETERLGAALDGVIVYVREEGWKELKVGCVFQIEPHTVQDERLGEAVVVGHAAQQSYVAHLGGPQGVKGWGRSCLPKLDGVIGYISGTRKSLAMGPVGSGTWRVSTLAAVNRRWTGIMPRNISLPPVISCTRLALRPLPGG